MKYAYIIGSNAYVVSSNVLSYNDGNGDKDFLRINAIYHGDAARAGDSSLDCDCEITDVDGTPFAMINGNPVGETPYVVQRKRDSINVLRADGTELIHIHQLDDRTAMSLEHNIVAELEVNMPVVAIRLSGEFKTGSICVTAENEKLYINGNGYGNSVLGGEQQLKFSADGVVLYPGIVPASADFGNNPLFR